jgi:hypothetical protein
MDLVDPDPLLDPRQVLGMYKTAVFPVHEAIINLKAEGKILVGGCAVEERGTIAFIVEADSPEELDALLQRIPSWGIAKREVTPLQAFEDRRDRDRQFAEQLEQSL